MSKTIWSFFRRKMGWLMPGIGVKRWIGVTLIGTTLLGIGFAIFILDFYRTAPETWWLPLVSALSLRFIDRTLRALIFSAIGVGLILIGNWGMHRALLKPFVSPGKPILDTVSAYHRRERGPRVVVIGGGTGLSTLLRGLKHQTNNLTAVVTVADDGGSSGEIRRNIGILPPGDIRHCLTALSDDEALLTQIFQYRFASGGAGLDGHSLGNLFITALAEITGSFEEAVAESGRVLAVQGRVLPATLHDVRLGASIVVADQENEILVNGESEITQANGHIKRVWLEPNNTRAFPPAIQAILSADLIIVGPGSLFTSILPNLLVADLTEALHASRAVKFYIGNVATQTGETDGFTCGDHIRVLEEYIGKDVFDLYICNNKFPVDLAENVEWVRPEADLAERYPIYYANLVDEQNPWRHDSTRLAKVVMDLFYERTGPLLPKINDEY